LPRFKEAGSRPHGGGYFPEKTCPEFSRPLKVAAESQTMPFWKKELKAEESCSSLC
jgi:hypothetical protein